MHSRFTTLTRWALAAGLLVLGGWAQAADSVTVTVLGTANPKLAGMPDGSRAGINPSNPLEYDVAPNQSPLLVSGLDWSAGSALRFQVSGDVDNCGGGCSHGGPDGASNEVWTNGTENGLSGLTAPLNSLVGVFIGAGTPDPNAAVAVLDFSTASQRSATTLAPALQQVFFIGDGLTGTGSGVAQSFLAPAGATRLYLATHDGYGWFNNSGSFTVTVSAVPEPASTALLLAGLGLVGVAARRRR